MASNSSSEYKVIADKIVSPDEDLIIHVRGHMYKDSVEESNRYATMSDVGEGGGGGPLVVPVNIKDGNDENFITFSRTGTGTARIATPQDDLSLRSARDITLIAGDDGPGNVYIGWGDATIAPEANNRVATIGDIEAANTADFTFELIEGEGTLSTMTIANHDMVIQTTRDGEQDADISINSADDVWINANDEIEITASNAIYLNGANGVFLGSADEGTPNPVDQVATIGDIQAASTADFVFTTGADPDYESTMTVTNNNMVLKTIVNTEASGNIKLESAQDISIDAEDISIRSVNNDGDVLAQVRLDRSNSEVRLSASAGNSDYFESADGWSTATWSGDIIVFTDASALDVALAQITGNIAYVSINGGTQIPYSYRSFGGGTLNMGVGASPAEGLDPVAVTSIELYYTNTSTISVDQDNDQEIRIYGNQIRVDIESTEAVNIESSGSDVEIMANQSVILQSNNLDVLIRASDDIEFTSNNNQGETPNVWKMTSSGRLALPGEGFIKSVIDGSSDGLNNNTIEIVPDFMVWDDGGSQYLVIEPTSPVVPGAPGHIHIRAGGTIDNSTADLILGGERNSVVVSDTEKEVKVSTAFRSRLYLTNLNGEIGTQFIALETDDIQVNDVFYVDSIPYLVDTITPLGDGTVGVVGGGAVFGATTTYLFTREEEYNNQWAFGSDGVFSGPYMGSVVVPGLVGTQTESLYIQSPNDDILITATGGNILLNGGSSTTDVYIGTASLENKVATIEDIEPAPSESSFVVEGGTEGTQPTFTGDPLFTGSYVKNGPLVHFQIQVDMDNITSFGTGQYYMTLPFPAKYGYKFRDGCVHDVSSGVDFAISGHVFAGSSTLELSSTDTQSGSVFDIPFTATAPVTLAAADNFHISGTYIMQEGV